MDLLRFTEVFMGTCADCKYWKGDKVFSNGVVDGYRTCYYASVVGIPVKMFAWKQERICTKGDFGCTEFKKKEYTAEEKIAAISELTIKWGVRPELIVQKMID